MKIRMVLCFMVFTMTSFFVAPSLFALPIVDGRFQGAGEGYTLSDSTAAGELWTAQDTGVGDLYIAFIQPLTLVDNSYGNNAIGWENRKKGHTFKDLLNSDRAEFTVTVDNTDINVRIDYLHDNPQFKARIEDSSGANDVQVATSLEYNYESYGSEHPELFGIDSDSPEVDAGYDVTDLDLADWIFEVVYEVRLNADVFGEGFVFDKDMLVAAMHNSPAKKIDGGGGSHDDGSSSDDDSSSDDGGNPIPEPGTVALLGIGLVGLAGGAVRRRLKKVKQQ